MKNKYTLKELVKVYEETYHLIDREAGIKAVLDFIGYKFPVDEEREAFERWYERTHTFGEAKEVIFAAWKAGREELRKEVCSDKCKDTKTEPAWIPWSGGSKSPIVGLRTRFEIEIRNGERFICAENDLRWSHTGSFSDIIAYRILES